MSASLSPAARRLISAIVVIGVLLLAFGFWRGSYEEDGAPIKAPPRRYSATIEQLNVPSQLAIWPWPRAQKDIPHPGVTHYLTRDGDGTTIELFHFDFGINSRLRLELFDQDEDDDKPFDNRVEYDPRGVGQITRQLNAQGRGPIVAAWNGAFFGYDRKAARDLAFHVAPIVLNGKSHAWSANHRWTFGVRYQNGKPRFKVLHLPERSILEKEFDFAAGSVQCLLLNGKPMKVEPFPRNNQLVPKPPIPSTNQEAGHIPFFDHMKSCRVSWAWTNDNRHFYLLLVQEPDTEGASILALLRGVPTGSAAGKGGWMVSDVQRFWQAMKVPNAVNSDAGGAAQLTYRLPDARYTLVTPRIGDIPRRLICKPDFAQAPNGGAMMYFYVRELKNP